MEKVAELSKLERFVTDNWADIIGILGFLMSLIIALREVILQRTRFSVHILSGYVLRQWEKKYLYLYVMIENRSRLPFSVTNIRLTNGGVEIPCESIPRFAWKLEDRNVYTSGIPAQLPELGATRLLLAFPALVQSPEADATSLTLEVCTNRGKPRKMTLPLPPDWMSLRIFL